MNNINSIIIKINIKKFQIVFLVFFFQIGIYILDLRVFCNSHESILTQVDCPKVREKHAKILHITGTREY